MSVLIKGMEMPKEDGALCIIIHSDGKVCHFFDLQGEQIATAVPVPPHGRLIDADALAKTLGITDMDCFKCAWGSNHGFCGRGGDFSNSCEAIEEAPTIIPADPAEEGEE